MSTAPERRAAGATSWPDKARAWRRRIAGFRHYRLVLFLALAAVVLLAGVFQQEPNTMLAASVQTEVIKIEVVNPAGATLALPRAWWVDESRCVERVWVRPAIGSKVYYTRPRHGVATIAIAGPAEWTHGQADAEERIKSKSLLEFEVRGAGEAGASRPGGSRDAAVPTARGQATTHTASSCQSDARLRLPVHGMASIGSDLPQVRDAQDPQLALMGGKLLLFGRALSRLLFVPLTFKPLQPDALYFSQELPLPGGSRIASASQDASGGDASSAGDASWYGFADISFESDDAGVISVEASTNARFVELYTPAPFRSHEDPSANRPDRIALSMGARLTGDPNLLWLYGLVAVFALLLALVDYLTQGKD